MCGGLEGNNEAMSEKYKNRAEIGALCTSGGGIERGNYMFDGYSTTNSLPLLIILIKATCDCLGPTKYISKLFLEKKRTKSNMQYKDVQNMDLCGWHQFS